MPRITRTRTARTPIAKTWLAGIAALLLVLSAIAFAADTAAAPAPSQIKTAKLVFIANGGQDTGTSDEYSGNQGRCYNQFYAAVKTWGRFELSDGPGDADLVIEVKFANPPASAVVVKGDTAFPYSDPRFTLTVFDPKTHFVLWSLTEHADAARLKGNRDKNYDRAMNTLVEDLKQLVMGPAGAGTK